MRFRQVKITQRLCVIGYGLMLAMTAAPLFAQNFPAKPVELTVLFPAGSSTDVVARGLADGISRHLGQHMLVMNLPVAGGAISYKYVQVQKRDGYFIVFNSNSISTAYYFGTVPFDCRAFDPVARVTIESVVVAVKTEVPSKDLRDMVAYAKLRPGALRIGNTGSGSHIHTSAVAFLNNEGVEMLDVPLAGSQVVTSLLGGHIDALVQLPSALTPHVKAGTLKILGVLASSREPVFPSVPTALDQGLKSQADLWRGITAPKETPPSTVARLEEAIRKTVNSPEFKAQGASPGFIPAFQASADFGKTIAIEDATLSKMMEKAGSKI